ncbi:hypothetical protein HMPREF3293_00266 [Christensenella minuta]|jgi:hypothetical protein|uniref:Uncharacterized protein n=1 Tax=Christensenella minuta TaxID=626937 RepID=A0A136Q880_9FIRM|nr:hypothetical protein HMPREF3293_00266 [Christensenella minuta]
MAVPSGAVFFPEPVGLREVQPGSLCPLFSPEQKGANCFAPFCLA